MKRDIQKRRVYFVMIYCRTLSLRATLEATSERFHVSTAVLRVDWARRDRWPKDVFENVTDHVLMSIYLLGIHRTLQQTELLLSKTTNDNCRVGALKLKADSLFKLINLQKSITVEGILERLENMERTLEEILDQKKKSLGRKDEGF
ncbi:MAG: hypothetical protein IBV52_07245 [Candidatus Bathyarchaeota archaeon]